MDDYSTYKKYYGKGTKKLSKLDFEKEFNHLNSIYSVLVTEAKATEEMRENFIFSHITGQEYPCDEWRFCGIFGMGGKYRRQTNTIDYYSEDRSPELDKLEKKINQLLKEIV